jgi:hypothetical protein
MPVNIPFKPVSSDDTRGLSFRSSNNRKNKTHESTALDVPIVAVDSEGYNGLDGKHRLDLVAAAGDNWTDHKHNEEQLTPEEIFEFLLSLPEKYGKALYFIYSGSYDATMWLKQLPEWAIKRWRLKKIVRWGHYLIKWIPRREFILYDIRSLKITIIKRGKKAGEKRREFTRRIHIYDVFGFFQMSFVKALEDWKVTDQNTIDRIAKMKGQRGKFSEVENAKILEYCLEECQLLVKLGNAFRKACVEANIKPQHWYGAGALAATLMRQYGIKNHISEAPEASPYIKRAYFGGRTEISYQGRLPRGGWQYDINSAYPTAMCDLPSLTNASWKIGLNSSTGFDKYYFSIWHIKWNCHGKEWGPFPWRHQDGRIFYPDTGEGFYHKIEIDAALKLYPDCDFEILDGIAVVPNDDIKPFKFIAERAAYRLKLKTDGDPANKPLKLGLNSLYGKTAQTIGENPPYQCFFWAGYTTAATRAKLLDAIRCCNGHIYSVATDGLISSIQIDELIVGTTLGTWERTKIMEGILIRPGVYKWRDNSNNPEKEWHYGTRGFQRDELLWETIEHEWDIANLLLFPAVEYKVTRFIGITQALARGTKWRDYLGEWIQQTRNLSFKPTWSTREWDFTGAKPGQIDWLPLKLVCNCNHQYFEGPSAMYSRLNEEDTEEGRTLLIDADQP